MTSKGKTTAESVWALLQEVGKNQKETARRFKETNRLLKEKREETARRFKANRYLRETDHSGSVKTDTQKWTLNKVFFIFILFKQKRTLEAFSAPF